MTNSKVPDADAGIDSATSTKPDAATAAKADPSAFEAHRALLFSIAYRMLGSASEAEDVVQDG
jgi:DNA-directed RNA polymerase specialized sigma24 family protein